MNRLLCKAILANMNELINTNEPDDELVALLSNAYIKMCKTNSTLCLSNQENVDPMYIAALGALAHHFTVHPNDKSIDTI